VAWRRARDAAPSGSALGLLLDRLLADGESGESSEALDAELDRSLAAAAPESLVARAHADAERELQRFRERMEPAVFDATRRRSVTDRLRRALGLPRLALAHPPSSTHR
jgi:hypothetical protein